MDGQNAVIEGTDPSRGPTTGGIEIWIYGTSLPNGPLLLYTRFGENVTCVVSTNELLGVPGFNLVPSRTPFSLAYYPVSCRLETVRAGFRSPFREDPPPTLLLEKVSANLSITSTSTKREPGACLLFAYLPPTQSHNSRPHPQKSNQEQADALELLVKRANSPTRSAPKPPKAGAR